ncbi:glycosyl transferase family 1 [Methylobacterium variabile]|jgi:glycosyltransferase involved in cell wall biosynthesis|uniref:Glycosyl transferase family 1 n=1 Tax=Methylobacterium variabile TaxID=298794 RepID=A0A0J6SAL3_9HYPH|nr:glycosyltransferase family 4 protein [Methylobacterium variabile]KMO30767.1 glycosyl transferase family 1 [Methylobacterium variabile]
MHVGILTNFATPRGGAEKVAIESARGLAERGVAVTLLHGVDGPADPMLDHPGVRRIGLGLTDVWERPAWRGAIEGIWHREAARRLARALADLPVSPDVLHLHQWTRSLSPAVFAVLARSGRPVAVTLHDYFLACPNGVYYRFDKAAPCALRPLSPGCLAAPCDPQSRAHKAVRVARSVVQRAAIGRGFTRHPIDLVHVSDGSRARLEPMLAGGPFRHHRVDNPVRVERAESAEPACGDAVAFVGRFTREKGADLVAEAARRAGLPALFVGDGPLEAELRAVPGAEVIGWRAPSEVETLLRRRARAVAAPARWLETGPLTVYEALAAGIPAVASDRAGAGERIRHGETGFLAPPEAGALAEVFGRLKDDATVRRLGQAAYDRYWAAPTTLDAHAEALCGLYAGMTAAAEAPSFQRSAVM